MKYDTSLIGDGAAKKLLQAIRSGTIAPTLSITEIAFLQHPECSKKQTELKKLMEDAIQKGELKTVQPNATNSANAEGGRLECRVRTLTTTEKEMSLYNMLFGVNSAATVLLATLGLTLNDVPRFRDCYIDGEHIVIHTRTGGGNRDYYGSEEDCRANYPEYFDGKEDPAGPWNSTLTENAYYLYDEDDDFDSTYANFHFKFPEELAVDLKALAERSETHKPSEKWLALFKAMESSNAQK
jgi:hypothetical protein